jgi:hypothetical protein
MELFLIDLCDDNPLGSIVGMCGTFAIHPYRDSKHTEIFGILDTICVKPRSGT